MLRQAALDRSYVSIGDRRTTSVHEFYRYPARFSPVFAAAAIRAFTELDDLVLDPFAGGGTTVIEAQLLGRRSIGSDLNALAAFVTRAKSETRSDEAIASVSGWAERVPNLINMERWALIPHSWEQAGYLRNLDGNDGWRVRKAIAQALSSLGQLGDESATRLARVAILRTAQSLLDMRSEAPTVGEFRRRLASNTAAMCEVSSEYSRSVRLAISDDSAEPAALVLNTGLPGLSSDLRARETQPPKLVLTSPPYPGVYVLYHRWKFRGRRETPAPYWIADQLDGNGLAHYTMAARSDPSLDTYFRRLRRAYEDLVEVIDPETWLVQLVGFSDVAAQLPRYLRVMDDVGLEEHRFAPLATDDDGRCWRDVPGRRWWVTASSRGEVAAHTSREVVLVHRLRRDRRRGRTQSVSGARVRT
jgi:hypothetical protein